MNSFGIRAITLGLNGDQLCLSESNKKKIQKFFLISENTFIKNKIEVHTKRITTNPLLINDEYSIYKINSIAQALNEIIKLNNIRWYCIPLKGNHRLAKQESDILLSIFRKNPHAFFHFIVANSNKIYSKFLLTATEHILNVSKVSRNGFENFRVGIGANIPSNTPFFPFSYHEGEEGFSIGIEITGFLIDSIKKSNKKILVEIRDFLIDLIIPIISKINALGITIEEDTGYVFKGVDISIAPYPKHNSSVSELIELIGSINSGNPGTLTYTSVITDALKTSIQIANIRSVGFNGLMFSLLEDSNLALMNDRKLISIEKLLLYSTVCGCGIDMIPINGNVTHEDLYLLANDVASLSTVLSKPLGFRVLPIPSKEKNEYTSFSHDFLTNTRILDLGHFSNINIKDVEDTFSYRRI